MAITEAAYAEAQMEIERLRTALENQRRENDRAWREVDAIAAERDALRSDAERYRWLRDVASGSDWESIGQTTDPDYTDTIIDAAMKLGG